MINDALENGMQEVKNEALDIEIMHQNCWILPNLSHLMIYIKKVL
jgi:hypothetical protein